MAGPAVRLKLCGQLAHQLLHHWLLVPGALSSLGTCKAPRLSRSFRMCEAAVRHRGKCQLGMDHLLRAHRLWVGNVVTAHHGRPLYLARFLGCPTGCLQWQQPWKWSSGVWRR